MNYVLDQCSKELKHVKFVRVNIYVQDSSQVLLVDETKLLALAIEIDVVSVRSSEVFLLSTTLMVNRWK